MPASTTRTRAVTSLALLCACAAFAGTACAGSGSSPNSDNPPPGSPPGGGNPTKLPPISGTPDATEFTNALGVFVSPSGAAANDGSLERPLNSIQAGIDLATRVRKRVYVCTGTFRENIVLADSISIIGALDCGTAAYWRLGAAPTRIEAPSSPAVRAKDIASATRLDGLDIVAPNAKDPSGSSIGLFADHAAGLTIANSKVTAGDGASGANGTEGVQLAQTGLSNGAPTVTDDLCDNTTCVPGAIAGGWLMPVGGAGGTSICAGAPGHDGPVGVVSGGTGGSGGLWEKPNGSPWQWLLNLPSRAPALGEDRLRTAPQAGASGTPSSPLGALTEAGYVAANGVAGTDGAPGNGGFGGRGLAGGPVRFLNPSPNAVYRGTGGPGGGAGGCAGLAGAAGTGGGASIALALIESPFVVDSTQLIAGRGGAGGLGTFGSDPTPGGLAGPNFTGDATVSARGGQNGAIPGISTNGSSGPSVGVLHSGAAPTLRGSTKITPGQAGAAIDDRSRTDPLGSPRSIPATPAGISKDILAL